MRVAADGRESLLKPGDQMTTSDAVTAVSVGDEIAWSQDAPVTRSCCTKSPRSAKTSTRGCPSRGFATAPKILDQMPDRHDPLRRDPQPDRGLGDRQDRVRGARGPERGRCRPGGPST